MEIFSSYPEELLMTPPCEDWELFGVTEANVNAVNPSTTDLPNRGLHLHANETEQYE